jgi:hypothetical protein
LRDNLTGARELALASDKTSEITNPLLPFTTRNPVGASSDLSHFVFSVRAQLLPEAAPGAINAYEIVNGELRLINVLDDESVDPGGGQVGGSAAGRATRTISADGSRVFFQSPNLADFAFGALYMRVNGTTTIPISVSHRPGDPSGAVPVTFHGISRDGSIVYFSSTTPLTEDATGGGAYGDLYRYDVQTDELKNLTVLTDPADTTADVATVVGISENGADVYFVSAANLTGDTSPGQQSIYVSYGDELHHVAVLGEGESSGPQQVKLSPSGRYLVFATWGQPTGQDNLNPLACKATAFSARPAGSCIETYVYDAVEDELSCMSCEPVSGGVRDAGMGIQNASVSEYKSRAVLDDGRAFFNTTARLAPADSNGRSDVYEWQDGEVSLISPGTANQDATFAEASADGRDVFFFTAQALVAQDVDRDVDLYDARAGGGMASQSQPRPAAPTCSGESCQGVAASPPGLVPTSTAFVGPHDPKPRRVQKKNKRRHRHSRNGSHKGTHKGPHKKRSSHAGKGRATKDHGGSR